MPGKREFEKVIFNYQEGHCRNDLRLHIGNRISKYMDVAYVYQELDKIPDGYQVPEGRVSRGAQAMQCFAAVLD